MRKLTVSINSTTNGIVTGPPTGDQTEWRWAARLTTELIESTLASLTDVDTILLGRATYQDLVRKWPRFSSSASNVTASLAEKINTTPKVVVSRAPMAGPTWGKFEPPAQITGNDVEKQIKKMKAAAGGEIITFGSPTLVQSLVNARLADEFQLLIHPVVMHEGRRLFDNLTARTNLRLADVDAFDNGVIRVIYTVKRR